MSDLRVQDLAHNLYRVDVERSSLEYQLKELNKKASRLWVAAGRNQIMDKVEEAYLELYRRHNEDD